LKSSLISTIPIRPKMQTTSTSPIISEVNNDLQMALLTDEQT
jgi:hypothetical protein